MKKSYYIKFDGYGFRYLLNEFINVINSKSIISHKFSKHDWIAITKVNLLYQKNLKINSGYEWGEQTCMNIKGRSLLNLAK